QTSLLVKEYPGTAVVYKAIEGLEGYIARHGGRRTGSPMVNITGVAGGQYQLRVAIPTDTTLPESGDIRFRQLIRGKYLITDVRGGQAAVNSALDRINDYVSDYRRTAMAIPFFSFVTDRSREADTTKWMTRIYYPIY
ncbi:MAG TPA: GyrI-like domain-containing protein, partial [Puia sp.]|nr:GyrI-like domain-containing protein [Puia sp.]